MKKGSAAIVLLLLLTIRGTPSLAANVYSIQVAASSEKGSAEETSQQMNRMGHDSFVRLETVPGKGQWYRVYVERFGSKAQADKEAGMMKSLGLLNEYFVRELKEVPATKPAAPRIAQTTPQPAGRNKAVSSGVHFLHVASFKEKKNAERIVTQLEKSGQKTFFAEEGDGADKWFRTYIGEFADRKNAQEAGALLKGKGLISYFKVVSLKR